MTTAQKIKELRLQKGLSQETLGSLVGVKKAAINKYETGRVVNIKSTTLKRLAEVLGVTPADLLDDTSSSSAPAPDPDEEHLLQIYRTLNVIGRRKAIERVEELTEIERYIKIGADQSDAI